MQTFKTKKSSQSIATNLESMLDQLHELQSRNSELQEKIDDLELLLQLNSFSAQIVNRDETLKAIQQFFVTKFQLDGYVLMLKTDSDQALEISSCYGISFDKDVWVKINNGDRILTKIFNDGESVYIPDLATEQYSTLFDVDGRAGSVLSLPLLCEKKTTIGILNLLRSSINGFSEAEIGFLQLIAVHAAGVIDKTILFHNTQELAYTDGLTSIFNRRYFDQRYSREILRAKRYKRALSLLMVDIDYFKKYNDTFGHLMGDKVLRKVANIIEEELRRADIVCRYGGEEFVVILPEIDQDNAFRVAEKLRTAVRTISFKKNKQPATHVTISIGVASFPDNGNNAEKILEAADKALYRAKELGRDKVVQAKV